MNATSIVAYALLALASATPGAALPDRVGLEAALNELEACRGLTGPECPPPLRRYTVHGARCMSIPPEEGLRAATCRVDLTLTYADPQQETSRHRDSCLRFGEREEPGRSPKWVVLQIRGRDCEMPSALVGDPNRLPRRAELGRTLIGRLQCYDPDGLTHCGAAPDRASVDEFRCRPIARGEDGRHRVACRALPAWASPAVLPISSCATSAFASSGRRRPTIAPLIGSPSMFPIGCVAKCDDSKVP